jgi:S1-C subfamily serine protease
MDTAETADKSDIRKLIYFFILYIVFILAILGVTFFLLKKTSLETNHSGDTIPQRIIDKGPLVVRIRAGSIEENDENGLVIRIGNSGTGTASTGSSEGSGFVLNHTETETQFVTCNHVVINNTSQTYIRYGEDWIQADVIFQSDEPDIAILSVKGNYDFEPLTLSDSYSYDSVYSIGYAPKMDTSLVSYHDENGLIISHGF